MFDGGEGTLTRTGYGVLAIATAPALGKVNRAIQQTELFSFSLQSFHGSASGFLLGFLLGRAIAGCYCFT